MTIKSDIEIAQEAKPLPITDIADACGMDGAYIEQYGRYKAKIDNRFLKETNRPDGKLVLVTAITPTPAGEGKTTTTVGLADGLRRIGRNAVVALREPSLGPVFGIKGGAAGGGYAQVVPIYAAASGYVQVAGWSSGGYGNYVIIYHGSMSDGNAYSTLYGHMRSVATSAGKYVKQGELIGYVGSTGNSTGNHLHLEVWKGGKKANAVNPRGYIPFPHN